MESVVISYIIICCLDCLTACLLPSAATMTNSHVHKKDVECNFHAVVSSEISEHLEGREYEEV